MTMLGHTQCAQHKLDEKYCYIAISSTQQTDLVPFDYHIFGLLTRSLWRYH